MVVFGIESLGRQPQLITLENEGGDNTNNPSPPTYTFFDVLEVPFGPQGLQPLAPPELHQPPGPPGSSGFPPGWPPAPSPAGGGERVETGNASRERFTPASATLTAWASAYSNTNEWWRRWWWSATTVRGKDNGLDRVSEYIRTPQIQPMVTPESYDEISGVDFAIVDSPPSAEQWIALEEPKDLDHLSDYIHVHPPRPVNNNSVLYLFHREYSRIRQPRMMMKIQ